jgi:hypothetical protein
MLTSRTIGLSQRPLRESAARSEARASAGSVPLFTADETWSRTKLDRCVAGEKDDAILEPGFWMTALIAFLPTVAGCFYLFLTQG